MALTERQLSKLRAEYLRRREYLLIKKVDGLAVKLFDKVFTNYLKNLEKVDGRLVYNDKNISLINGLTQIYNQFVISYNIPTISGFIDDLHGITPLNARYFEVLTQNSVKEVTKRVTATVNKRLGIDEKGRPKQGGFADKFIRDKTLLKKIQRNTTQALTNKTGFQEFRKNLTELIRGNPGQKLSGGLQQYYRNYAYDTFLKVDRLNQDVYANGLGLRYFFWSGGVIKTSRPLCVFCNGKIIDSNEFKRLKYEDITDKERPNGAGELEPFNSGLDETWVPMDDLGQYGCRHRKDYTLDSVAERLKGNIINISSLLK